MNEPRQASAIEQAKQRKEELDLFVQEVLVADIDYGNIPKTDKYCLFKSGAEKLCDLYGYGKRFELISRDVNSEEPYFAYEIKAVLFNSDTGQIVAEGVGCCNSKEKKYLKYAPFDTANIVLKMAKKRAFVDAVLTATRSSDVFSQDIVDDDRESESEQANGQKTANKQQQQQKSGKVQLVSEKQLDYIYSLMSQHRLSVEQVRKELRKRYQVNDCKELSREQASDFIKILKEATTKAS